MDPSVIKMGNVQKDNKKLHILILTALKIGLFRGRSVKERIGKYLKIMEGIKHDYI